MAIDERIEALRKTLERAAEEQAETKKQIHRLGGLTRPLPLRSDQLQESDTSADPEKFQEMKRMIVELKKRVSALESDVKTLTAQLR